MHHLLIPIESSLHVIELNLPVCLALETGISVGNTLVVWEELILIAHCILTNHLISCLSVVHIHELSLAILSHVECLIGVGGCSLSLKEHLLDLLGSKETRIELL